MSEVMQKYEKLAVEKERIEKIQALLKKGCDKEFVISVGYTEDEYLKAEAALCMNA